MLILIFTMLVSTAASIGKPISINSERTDNLYNNLISSTKFLDEKNHMVLLNGYVYYSNGNPAAPNSVAVENLNLGTITTDVNIQGNYFSVDLTLGVDIRVNDTIRVTATQYEKSEYTGTNQSIFTSFTTPFTINVTYGVLSVPTPHQPWGDLKGICGRNVNYWYYMNWRPPIMAYYKFFWGDGTDSDWIGPWYLFYYNGWEEPAFATHSWGNESVGYNNITAKIRFWKYMESDYSQPLTIRMYYLGDTNGDNVVDFGDINPFVLALSQGETAYNQAFSDGYWYTCDINQDGIVDFGDINPFITLISN